MHNELNSAYNFVMYNRAVQYNVLVTIYCTFAILSQVCYYAFEPLD